ncbi:hypothetical protein FRUB_05654 [Fimbriiglobus ruber]|uniref:Uncharacterized protein n=1 Tax=Fimbriiglobus ruber TaxID=1908690 RepID=A0A225DJ74_9BACT|nr:hypothetical protein FRUB_05654 [Fimbriiglobus ruber]
MVYEMVTGAIVNILSVTNYLDRYRLGGHSAQSQFDVSSYWHDVEPVCQHAREAIATIDAAERRLRMGGVTPEAFLKTRSGLQDFIICSGGV